MSQDDVAGALSILHDDVVLHVPGTQPLAGDHRGPDAVLAFVVATRSLTEDGEDLEVLDILEGEDLVAVCAVVRARRSGRPPLVNRTVHVHRLVDGRIAEMWFHNYDGLTVDEFWS